MAGSFGWNNLRHINNMHDHLNHARQNRSYGPSQIACRICHQVFFTTQALIDHIESHMKTPSESSLLLPQRDHLFTPNPTLLSPLQNLRNPFYHSINLTTPVARPTPRKAHDGRAIWTERAPAGETRWGPVTRPFLNQLDHGFVINNKPASPIMQSQNSGDSDFEVLDLTLKL